MKYLLNFKKYNLFESNFGIYDLSVDESIVEKYYDENFDVDEEHYIYLGDHIYQFVDSEGYMESTIDDYKSNFGILDFEDEDDFRSYINKNESDFISLVNDYFKELLEDKTLVEVIKDLEKGFEKLHYTKTLPNRIKNAENLSDLDFEDSLELIQTDELAEIINDVDETEYVNWAVENRYADMTAQEYLEDMGYSGKDLVEHLSYYINYDEMDAFIKENEDYDYKLEYYLGNIGSDEDMQNNLLEYDSKNAIYLFDIIDEEFFNGKSEYFQQMYIDEKKKADVNDYENEAEWEKEELIDIIFDLYEKFGINSEIMKKYRKYARKINKHEFNL